MAEAMCAKFQPGAPAADILLSTGNRPLVHHEPWVRDAPPLWGADEHGNGDNVLGRMLEHCRDDQGELGLHDHPWYSASMLLTGSLIEHWREDGGATVMSSDVIDPFQVIVRSPRIAHRLAIGDGHPITLVATGPPIREWGFRQRDDDRFPAWTHWRSAH